MQNRRIVEYGSEQFSQMLGINSSKLSEKIQLRNIICPVYFSDRFAPLRSCKLERNQLSGPRHTGLILLPTVIYQASSLIVTIMIGLQTSDEEAFAPFSACLEK